MSLAESSFTGLEGEQVLLKFSVLAGSLSLSSSASSAGAGSRVEAMHTCNILKAVSKNTIAWCTIEKQHLLPLVVLQLTGSWGSCPSPMSWERALPHITSPGQNQNSELSL